MTTSEAIRVVAGLKAAYPRQQIDPETLQVYTRHLAKIPVDVATQAAEQHIAESQFFPTIAELLARSKAILRSLQAVDHPDDEDLVRLTPEQLATLKNWAETIGREDDHDPEQPMPGEAWFAEHGAEVAALTERSIAIDRPATYGALPMGEEQP